MKPIEVFYHFYIPNDHRACMWSWWVDTQIAAIKQSKLNNIANVNMAITLPKYWNHFLHQQYTKNGQDYDVPDIPTENLITFSDKVREYINIRYPFVNILDMRDLDEPNIYEGHTLNFLYNTCKEKDVNVLYFNNKGITKTLTSPSTLNWREILDYICIANWEKCVAKLQAYDVVGVKDRNSHPRVLSGNYFWANSNYIKQLVDPLDSTSYINPEWFPEEFDRPGWTLQINPGERGYRWAFEHWPVSLNPKIYWIVDTKTHHYAEYCFPEQIQFN